MKNFLLLVLFAFSVAVFAKSDQVVAKKDGTPVYQNKLRQVYEKPIYTAKADEFMEVLESDNDFYHVKLANGKDGWVEKKLAGPQSLAKKNVSYTFDAADVQGWLDNPQAVYILDMTDPNFKPIKLDKSFSDNLDDNVDREKSEENNGLYRPEAASAQKK